MRKIIIILISLILLIVGNLSGCTSSENIVPTVTISSNKTNGVAPLTVEFQGIGNDPDGEVESYSWDFGDGGTSTQQNPTHIFQSSGIFTVTLTVIDDKDGRQSTALIITVIDGKVNQNPICSLTVNTNSGEAPLTVLLSMTANDEDGSISSWNLDINNDGNPEYSESGNPPSTKQHAYTNAGTYKAKLTVNDNSSGAASSSVTITVTSPPPIKILSHSSYYNSGYFYVVGEVLNSANTNVEFVKIVATFYDEDNEMIGSSFTYIEIDVLTPNQKSPFELNNYPDNLIVDHYELSLQYRETSNLPYNQVEVLSHKSSVEYGYYKVIGEVQNTGNNSIEFVKIVVTFYSSSGTVIGAGFTYTDLDELSPGQKSPFELSSYPRTASEMSIDYYSIVVQARIT
jgi:PKD repeat protein